MGEYQYTGKDAIEYTVKYRMRNPGSQVRTRTFSCLPNVDDKSFRLFIIQKLNKANLKVLSIVRQGLQKQ